MIESYFGGVTYLPKVSDIELWCDSSSDVYLFQRWRNLSDVLDQITKVDVIPRNVEDLPSDLDSLAELLTYDRADWYFCYRGIPILVVEITRHGYTGDNSLQRFPRIMRTAAARVPIIYFGPTQRTRTDELKERGSTAVARNVSAHLYQGFCKLMEMHEVPVVTIPVNNDKTGIPFFLSESPTLSGADNLIDVIGRLFQHHLSDLIERKDLMRLDVFRRWIDYTYSLSRRGNTRPSEIRRTDLSYDDIQRIFYDPYDGLIRLLPRHREYFFTGKRNKLPALLCLENAAIEHVELPDGSVGTLDDVSKLPSAFMELPWSLLYCGYEWRGEPNTGVLAHFSTMYRSTGSLIVTVWPRVFYHDSERRRRLLTDLMATVTGSNRKTRLAELAELRKATRKQMAREDDDTYQVIAAKSKSIGVWNEGTTAARIYRDVSDLIILNDTILLGNRWKHKQPARKHAKGVRGPSSSLTLETKVSTRLFDALLAAGPAVSVYSWEPPDGKGSYFTRFIPFKLGTRRNQIDFVFQVGTTLYLLEAKGTLSEAVAMDHTKLWALYQKYGHDGILKNIETYGVSFPVRPTDIRLGLVVGHLDASIPEDMGVLLVTDEGFSVYGLPNELLDALSQR